MRLPWRRSQKKSNLPPQLWELGLERILDASPNALLIATPEPKIIYRNAAATAVAQRVAVGAGKHGPEVLAQLRANAARAMIQARKFPHTQTIKVSAGGYEAEIEVRVHRLDDWYLAYWADVTADRRNARLLERTSGDMTGASEDLTELGTRLATDTERVSDRADAVASGANELTTSIRAISASTLAAVNNIRSAVGAADLAQTRITKLADSIGQIGSVSDLITSIAEQTNLLALNATIEAARAGESGKGFAVVAGEVKELARRTSEATGQIGAMIEAIQSDSRDTSTSIEEILRLINEMETQQTTIASAVEEQSATASDMTTSISETANATQAIAEGLAKLREAAENVAAKAADLRTHQLTNQTAA